MSAAMPVLRVEDLRVRLPPGADRLHAVDRVSFEIAAGQVVCLLGESGSGKSVIAHTVMGLLPAGVRPVTGRVLLAGEDLLQAAPDRLRRLRGEKMSMIFQEPMTALNPVMTCGSQIDELLRQHTAVKQAQRRARILEMLERVRLPDPARIYAAYPHQLSGGQRQRIMIALALILKPMLLIADEPTTALDVTTQAEILHLIRELQRENGTAVLFITHDFGVVSEIADRVAVLKLGELVESGPARELLVHPRHEYTRMLLDAVPSLVPRNTQSRAQAPVHLRTRALGKVFESGRWLRSSHQVRAAESVELSVNRGETLGIVGESGSGKSTVARMIARLIEPSSGEIELDGEVVTRLRGEAALRFRRKVQVVFQDPYRSLNPRRTVGAAIAEGPMNFGAARSEAYKKAAELLELVSLTQRSLDRYPHEFSGGQRQRICIARALAIEPEVLIADEAVSALDVSVQAQILDLLRDLQGRLGLTMIFITHDLRVAAQICNRVAVMQRGRVVEQGPIAEVFRHPVHAYTRALLEAAPGRGFAFGGVN
ncbi:MAG: ABC transporter ATP-binding protein [Betaproteobacteria bacterium]|nr:ABC transporter ATP-binding protein [Betaproteobacteria bacterium]